MITHQPIHRQRITIAIIIHHHRRSAVTIDKKIFQRTTSDRIPMKSSPIDVNYRRFQPIQTHRTETFD